MKVDFPAPFGPSRQNTSGLEMLLRFVLFTQYALALLVSRCARVSKRVLLGMSRSLRSLVEVPFAALTPVLRHGDSDSGTACHGAFVQPGDRC